MKVLIISFRYKPFNSIGTNRINALVEFFIEHRIDYRVMTSCVDEHNTINFNSDPKVYYIPWFNFLKLKYIRKNEYKRNVFSSTNNSQISVKSTKLLRIIDSIKKNISKLIYPDPYVSWVFNSLKIGKNIVTEFQPDYIYSSSYPYSSHLVAKCISKHYKAKWVAELRDPWIDNHSERFKLYKWIDKLYSRFVFKSAYRLVAVTETWMNDLNESYKKQTILVRNGFLKKEIKINEVEKEVIKIVSNSTRKKIVYTGSIFFENQNFEEFVKHILSEKSFCSDYEFIYAGYQYKVVESIFKKYKSDQLNLIILGQVDLNTSLYLQNCADYLLLLNWKPSNKSDLGIVPGKFYEYLGMNKPIILWNQDISNELLNLSLSINKQSTTKKILIINKCSNITSDLSSFVFDTSLRIVDEFSRFNQFSHLLENLKNEETK